MTTIRLYFVRKRKLQKRSGKKGGNKRGATGRLVPRKLLRRKGCGDLWATAGQLAGRPTGMEEAVRKRVKDGRGVGREKMMTGTTVRGTNDDVGTAHVHLPLSGTATGEVPNDINLGKTIPADVPVLQNLMRIATRGGSVVERRSEDGHRPLMNAVTRDTAETTSMKGGQGLFLARTTTIPAIADTEGERTVLRTVNVTMSSPALALRRQVRNPEVLHSQNPGARTMTVRHRSLMLLQPWLTTMVLILQTQPRVDDRLVEHLRNPPLPTRLRYQYLLVTRLLLAVNENENENEPAHGHVLHRHHHPHYLHLVYHPRWTSISRLHTILV